MGGGRRNCKLLALYQRFCSSHQFGRHFSYHLMVKMAILPVLDGAVKFIYNTMIVCVKDVTIIAFSMIDIEQANAPRCANIWVRKNNQIDKYSSCIQKFFMEGL